MKMICAGSGYYIRSACISRGTLDRAALVPQPSLPPLSALVSQCCSRRGLRSSGARVPSRINPSDTIAIPDDVSPIPRETRPGVNVDFTRRVRVSLPRFAFFTITVRHVCIPAKGFVAPSFFFLLFGFSSRGLTYLSLSTCLSVPPLFRRPSHTSLSILPRRGPLSQRNTRDPRIGIEEQKNNNQ